MAVDWRQPENITLPDCGIGFITREIKRYEEWLLVVCLTSSDGFVMHISMMTEGILVMIRFKHNVACIVFVKRQKSLERIGYTK